MNETATRMLVVLISFWVVLLVLSNIFAVNLSKTDITNQEIQPNELNALNGFEALLGIMTFQYSEDIPVLVSIFLDAIFLFTIIIGLIFIRG